MSHRVMHEGEPLTAIHVGNAKAVRGALALTLQSVNSTEDDLNYFRLFLRPDEKVVNCMVV